MIKKLQWDSDFWKVRIADCVYENDDEIKDYLSKEKADIIQTQVNIDKAEEIRKLEALNFKFIDLNVTYAAGIDLHNKIHGNYCIADENDIDDIENIAGKVFKHSRYNVISVDKTKEFYMLWAKKAVLGELDDVCLIEKGEDGSIKGFVTVKKTSEEAARIGLIGVNPLYQNESIGTKLVNQAMSYLTQKGVKKLYVSTQGSNVMAQNFYIKNGFKVYDVSTWLYLFT